MTEAGAAPEESPPAASFGSTVTILFSDIRGFTEYTDAHGDEASYRMLQHHNGIVKEQLALFGGHIVKTQGDSFMVSFDAARTAMTCAVGIQRALTQSDPTEEGAKVQIGIGINTGEPIREAGDFFGGTVNLAARICALAGPGQILISETTRYVVGKMEGTDYVDRGYFEVKGFQEPQHLFEVDWSGIGAAGAAPAAAPRPKAAAAPPVSPTPSAPTARSKLPVFAVVAAVALLLIGGGVFFQRTRGGFPPGSTKPGQAVTEALKPGAASLAKPTGAEAPAAPVASPAAQAKEGAGPPSASQAASPGPAASQQSLLGSDDFADPAKGLFQNNQQGTARIGLPGGGGPHAYQWEYGYLDRSLVARIKGPYPPNQEQALLSWNAPALEKLSGDFAAEVRARATKSAAQARYGLSYTPSAGDMYVFSVAPEVGSFGVVFNQQQQRHALVQARTGALKRGDEENLLRMEIRGATMQVVINGRQVDSVGDEGLGRRGGTLNLNFSMQGPPADGEVEVRFTEFKLFSLAQ